MNSASLTGGLDKLKLISAQAHSEYLRALCVLLTTSLDVVGGTLVFCRVREES